MTPEWINKHFPKIQEYVDQGGILPFSTDKLMEMSADHLMRIDFRITMYLLVKNDYQTSKDLLEEVLQEMALEYS